MFVIKPIRNKEEQKLFCRLCSIPFLSEDYAYKAELDGNFAGICQFRIDASIGIIDHLVPLPGVDDWEMMFIMGRQTMNFVDLCGAHTCRTAVNAGDERLLLSIGFKKLKDESFYIDLRDQFNGCGHHKVQQ